MMAPFSGAVPIIWTSGIFLSCSVFASGQLYVALSRVRRVQNIVVFNPTGTRTITNVVHPGVRSFLDALDQDAEANPPVVLAAQLTRSPHNN